MNRNRSSCSPFLTVLLLCGVLTACGGTNDDETNSSSSSGSLSSSSSSSASSSASSGNPIANMDRWQFILGVNAGGDVYKATDGLTFEADKYFTNGTVHSTTATITGTTSPALYQTERYGDVNYEIPLGSGLFKVVIKLSEQYFSDNGERSFNIAIENKMLASNLDIHAMVGQYVAYDLVAPEVEVTDGSLSINLTSITNNATISGIEVYADKNNAIEFSDASVQDGEQIYNTSCAQCHGTSGNGSGVFPSLIKSQCDVCASPAALISSISKSMPVNGSCTGECATKVAGFILANFNDTPVNAADCRVKASPIRRLTRFEYNNTVNALFGDDTRPGNALPSEEIGNGFGNDARSMSVSSLLAEQYGKVAEGIAQRVIDTPAQWQRLHSCVQTLSSATEDSCASQIIDRLLTRAFRRTATSEEIQTMKDLFQSLNGDSDFKKSIAAVIEAVLQSPEFLYRAELGTMVNGRLKPTNYEMASRLSYFFWGSMPDDTLLQAAAEGKLSTPEQIKAQAVRLLDDDRSREMIRYFFDAYLPISNLSQLERDSVEFPSYNSLIGSLMREETQTFLEHIIFDGPGDWQSALTAPYSYMNGPLAQFYGINGVSGDQFQKVDLDTTERLGLLTHAGVLAGTIHAQTTNPVTRGAYVMSKLLCVNIPLPTGDLLAEITPPDPDSAATARQRFGQHASDPVCKTCHELMDPVGLVFENYDAVGLYRHQENNVMIDASGGLPGTNIEVSNAIELAHAIAGDPRTHECFAYNWANFAYGKTVGASESCITDSITMYFDEVDYDIKSLLIELTQTDAFLYLPADHRP